MKEKGITLVALIVTIIIMLILAAVTFGAINGGLFNYAGKAVSKVELYSIIEELEAAGIMKGKKNLNGTLSEVLGDDYSKYDSTFKVVNGELVYIGEDPKTVENLFELGLKESAIENASAVCAVLGHNCTPANYINPKTCTRCGYTEGEKLVATTPHPDQSAENTDIGIGTDGELVNLDNWTYEKTSGTWHLTAYTGTYSDPGGEIEGKVPQKINNINVTSMQETFKNNTSLKIAPEMPTTIINMNSTFRGCTALRAASIIPYGVTDVSYTFQNCTSLVTLPKEFNLPESVKGRIIGLFSGCTSLKELPNSFKVPEQVNSVFSWFSGCTNLEKLPDGFTISDNVSELLRTFQNCIKLTELPDSFRLPSNANNTGYMFAGSGITKLPEGFTIPEGCNSISNIFNGCNKLESLPEGFSIPSTVKNMEQAFQGCSKLSSIPIIIPNGVTNLNYVFYGCSNLVNIPTDLIIPETVSSFYYAFKGCSKLEGSIIIDGAPSNIGSCLNGTATTGNGLTVKYTDKCTNIDSIRATISSGAKITFEEITSATSI